MLRRRSTAATAVTLLLAAPVLSSCGFNYDTNNVTTISAGINDRDGNIDILGAVIVADEDDRGVFAATLTSNTNPTAAEIASGDVGQDALVGLSAGNSPSDGDDAEADIKVIGNVDPITIQPPEAINLFAEGGIPVEGDFRAGDVVPVQLTFQSGQVSNLQVTVQSFCHQYAVPTLDLPTDPPSDILTESDEPPETEAPDDETPSTDLYSCDYLDPVEMHSEPGEGEQEQEQFPSENEGE